MRQSRRAQGSRPTQGPSNLNQKSMFEDVVRFWQPTYSAPPPRRIFGEHSRTFGVFHSRPEELVFLHVVLKRNVSNNDFVPVTGEFITGPVDAYGARDESPVIV